MTDKTPKATHQGEIVIGDITIPCAVLEDGTRVLRERSVAKALKRKGGGAYWQKKREVGGQPLLPEYISVKNLHPFINNDIRKKFLDPIRYKTQSGTEATGLPATLLPEVCDVWLKTRENKALTDGQEVTAKIAEILMRGFAKIGIIALVDEATGYQEIRDRLALQKILEKYISHELLAWTNMFPNDFYKEMFRLKGWQYRNMSVKRPQVVGHYTNDLIYERLESGVLEELKKKNPRTPSGHRKNKHFQWLTNDLGQPKLRDHMNGVIALMRASTTWGGFLRLMNRAYPKKGATLEMNLEDIDA